MAGISLQFDINGAFSEKVVQLNDEATVELDAALGNVFVLRAQGDRIISAPTNPTDGQKIIIRLAAIGGDRDISLSDSMGGFRFGSDITGLTTIDQNASDYVTALYNGADEYWDVIAYAKGYSNPLEIGFDTSSSEAGGSSLTTLNWSHTISGNNRLLLVGVFVDGGSTAEVISGITYNSVPMTQLSKLQRASPDDTAWTYLYYLIAPDTGTHDIEVTTSVSAYIGLGIGASYTETNQSSQPDAANEDSAHATTSISTTVTTVAEGCWVMAYGYNDNAGIIPGIGMNPRAVVADAAMFGDSAGSVTPPGNYVIGISGPGGNVGIQAASIKPITA